MTHSLVHFAGETHTPCGVAIIPFLPRTGVLREVTCEECRDRICMECEGYGLWIREDGLAVWDEVRRCYIECRNCGGTGLRDYYEVS